MRLDEFNQLPAEEAAEFVLACARVHRWAQEIVAHRPYGSVAEVVAAAERLANPWTEDEVDAALAGHPRIGERADGEARDAQMSRAEQSGVDPADDDVQMRLRRGNSQYEEKFGFVFLIRAAGRSAEEILTALDQRLDNDPATERRIAAQQLRQIAALRLEGALS